MTSKYLRHGLTNIGMLTGHPLAFAILAGFSAAWWFFDRATFDFHAVAVLGTWLMTLFIQRAAHRDPQAVQAKLDELLRSSDTARSELTALDNKTAGEIVEHRKQARLDDPHPDATA